MGVGHFVPIQESFFILMVHLGETGFQYVANIKEVSPCPMLHPGIRDSYKAGIDHLAEIEEGGNTEARI